MTNQNYLLTSESVSEGHPDKICDQISDAVLDEVLSQDPFGRVGCETSVTTGLVLVFGEITTKAKIDVKSIVKNTIKKIGYDIEPAKNNYTKYSMLIKAYQMHYRQSLVSGKLDLETFGLIQSHFNEILT